MVFKGLEKEFLEQLTVVAIGCSSIEELKGLAEETYGIEFNEDLEEYIEKAFLKSRARLPSAEKFFTGYGRMYRFVWNRRHLPEIQEIMDNPLLRECKNCGNPFEFRFTNKGLFCSRQCSIEYNNRQKKETDIERITREWLESNHISYEEQYRIDITSRRSTIVDFFIKPNICLYADDEYWHSSEKSGERDGFQNKELPKLGYRVIRISGENIKAGNMPEELLILLGIGVGEERP